MNMKYLNIPRSYEINGLASLSVGVCVAFSVKYLNILRSYEIKRVWHTGFTIQIIEQARVIGIHWDYHGKAN